MFRLPVTVLTGMTGAGKSTLLAHVLDHCAGLRVDVLRNAGEDCLPAIGNVADEGRLDALVIELAGYEGPVSLAEAMMSADEPAYSLAAVAYLDSIVTVVDASRFLQDFNEAAFLRERGHAHGEEDDRTVADVQIEQVEFCDLIVLNKIDLVDEPTRARLTALLHALNPRATIVPVSLGRLPVDQLLDTGRFDFDATSAGAGWLAALRGEPSPAGDNHGIGSFVYRRRRPFHPRRFADLVHTDWLREHGTVLRSRGVFWLASRPDISGDWNQAGGVCRHGAAGLWWAAVDAAEWPQDDASLAAIRAESESQGKPAPFGDRRQEWVFIGQDLNRAGLEAALDACLLTDAEMAAGEESWLRFDDPFPPWEEDAFDHHDHDDHRGHAHDHGDGPCDCEHPDGHAR